MNALQRHPDEAIWADPCPHCGNPERQWVWSMAPEDWCDKCPPDMALPKPPDAPTEAELTELDSEFQGPCTDESHVREGCSCP